MSGLYPKQEAKMTRDHVDLRVRRTEMVLREALIDLIEEKGFDAVTGAALAVFGFRLAVDR